MYHIYEKLSKQWVSSLDGQFVLSLNREDAIEFNSELPAYTVIGRYFGDRQFDCEVYKVEVNDV